MRPEDITALPLDELALRVLEDANANGTWSWRNWMIETAQALGRNTAALRALSEAWTWLSAKGLVAWDPDQDSETSIFVTRRGELVVVTGDVGCAIPRAMRGERLTG
jgi:hypothetical protein